jgi:hypothetical protein
MDGTSPFCVNRQMMSSMFQGRMLVTRMFMLYRICSKFLQPMTSQGDMIDDVIGPGLSNPDQFCYINSLVQTLFHILALRRLVLGWPNDEPTITKRRAVFIVIAQGKMTSAVSMEQICEKQLKGTKDCSELSIQIFEALRESAPESLQPIIHSLICFELNRQVPFWEGLREVAQPPAWLLQLPVTEFSNLSDALHDFCLVNAAADPDQPQRYFIKSFPRFLFIHLGRLRWSFVTREKDCRRVDFPLAVEMTKSAQEPSIPHWDHLRGVIAHFGPRNIWVCHYIALLRPYGQWIEFNGRIVHSVTEKEAVEDNFPERNGSTRTASILLYVVDD